MQEIVFQPDSTRLIIAFIGGIVILLALIIKWKVNPILALLVASLCIGLGAGMSVTMLTDTMERGAGNTLQGIVLLIGLGSMFGGILETSGGAKCVAQTLIGKFGEKKAGFALGFTGLIVGTTVFFEAGVMILMPLAFGLASKTKKSVLYYAIPLLAGLASGFAFIPPSAGSVLVANILNVDLGMMILVGIPTGVLSLLIAGVFLGKVAGGKILVEAPIEADDGQTEEKLPSFSTVVCVVLIPIILILLSTLSSYVELPYLLQEVVLFLGTPFIALLIAIFVAMYFLGIGQAYSMEELKGIIENSLKPTAGILLVITGGGIISEVLQVCGMGDLVSSSMEESGLPLVLVAFLIAGLIRICIGAAVVSMTMTASIMMAMPGIELLSPLYLATMVLAINGGASAFSHVNDSGFWLVSSLLKMNEKTTLQTWSVMETIIGFVGLGCALVIAFFA